MISLTNHYSKWGRSELVIIYPMPPDRPARDLHGSPLQCWPAVTDIEQINRTWLYIDNDEYVYIYMYNIIIYSNIYYIYTIHMRRYNSIIISHQFVFCLNNYTHAVYIYIYKSVQYTYLGVCRTGHSWGDPDYARKKISCFVLGSVYSISNFMVSIFRSFLKLIILSAPWLPLYNRSAGIFRQPLETSNKLSNRLTRASHTLSANVKHHVLTSLHDYNTNEPNANLSVDCGGSAKVLSEKHTHSLPPRSFQIRVHSGAVNYI